MPLEWKPELSVGIGEIDVHHRKIISKTSEIADIMENNGDRDKLIEDVKYLMAYVGNHFETEEKYMSTNRYPEYEIHKQEHSDFAKRLEEMYDTLRVNIKNDEELTKIGREIYNWFLIHINQTDRLLGTFLKNKMIK